MFTAPVVGELNRRVDLQSATPAMNDAGGLDYTYATVATVWGRVRQIYGGKLIQGAQVEERATHNICIRWRADAASWGWLIFNGRRLKVVTVADPDEGRRWLEILAEEIRAV